MDKKLVFIVGVGRSGTSLLQSMLNAHPEIAFLPETGFLRSYVFRQKRVFKDVTEKENFVRTLYLDDKYKRTQVNPESIVTNSESYIQVYYSLLKSYAGEESKYVGDKDPRFLDFLPELNNILPSSKVIHIIRDPRDVVLSRTKADWSKRWPFFMHACMYKAQLERGRRLGRKIFRKNYLEIYYENLIINPEQVLKEIMEFLELEYNDSMLNFRDSAKSLVDQTEMQWKKETLGPLLSRNAGKWQKQLSESQIYTVQQICSETFKRHPYNKRKMHLPLGVRAKSVVYMFFGIWFMWLYPLRLKFLK